jgi:Helix-turn-helix domain
MTDLGKNNSPLVFPHPPILASDCANWKNIQFAHFQQPPRDIPEHVSPRHTIYHFAHLFKKSTNTSPHQYLIRCRVERAKQLMLMGNLSIAAIAQTVGFASQGHFTRPHYHANYYAAFVIGSDGHNIEVVCHEPEA